MVKHVIFFMSLLLMSIDAAAANRTPEILGATLVIFIISAIAATIIIKRKNIKETPVKILTFGVYFWVWVFCQGVVYSLLTTIL